MINSQLLLFINLAIGLLLVLYFLSGRHKPKAPTRLNMRAPKTKTQASVILEPEPGQPIVSKPEPTRNLSVIFMYNGHDWEAHEVLGVPQGASMHQVTKAYQQLVLKSDPRSLQFFEMAYSAISEKHRKQKI